ncbi:uncharacterized protein F4822DRAFT_432109 [Hypoxylon trugodes]|uniref:uncharacterized protein n=1 Tax=Hypoxylon trugodes TaxID=326681 RepID=UPI00219FAECB|nr:uncharacterized protein F4822DRAFT_432109 [Hypoxylon trugodes]KAI1385261.1 hypothetical protein F4822DRAFT_432109 [Hypoxylon trugodes]
MAEAISIYSGFTALSTYASYVFRRGRHRSRRSDDGTGIIELFTPDNPDVDICFVHGLGGDRIQTWKWADQDSEESNIWPKDFLPQDAQEGRINVRILSYGYKSFAPTPEYLTQRTLYRHSQQLLSSLAVVRKGHIDRPLIFVGHSLGGVVIKSALIFSSQAKQSELSALSVSATGIIFLGTPHTETISCLDRSMWPSMLAAIIQLNKMENTSLIRHLDAQSFTLQARLEPFKALSDNISIVSYYEGLPSSLGDVIVPIRHPYGDKVDVISADHRNMCKFPNSSHPDYRKVSSEIFRLCREATIKAQSNWDRYGKRKDQEEASKKLMGDVRSTPETSRSNDFCTGVLLPPRNLKFVGRVKELGFLHDALVQKCPQVCTSPCATVNLHGGEGIGKTAVALEFAYANQDFFTSIFWIPATSQRSIERSIVNIESILHRQSHESNPTMASSTLTDSPSDADFDEGKQRSSISSVMEWFQSPENSRWLVILDDLNIEGDPDIARYIPNTTCVHGHCIITSRTPIEWDIVTNRRVNPLSPDESLSLLKSSTGLSKADERELADLSKSLGYIPLALKNAASFISSTKSTLKEYMRRRQSSISIRQGEAKTLASLKNLSPLSTSIFQVCCVLSLQSVCVSVFLSNSFRKNCPGDSMIAIRELAQNSLAALTEDERYLITQNTVRDFGRSTLSDEQLRFASQVACESSLSVANSLREVRDGNEAFRTSFAECDIATVMSQCYPLITTYLPSSYEWDIDLDLMGQTCEKNGRNSDASDYYNLQVSQNKGTISALRKTKMRLALTRRISGDDVRAKELCEELIQPQGIATPNSEAPTLEEQPQGDDVGVEALRFLKKEAHKKSDSEGELALSRQIAAAQEHRFGYKDQNTLEAVKELSLDLIEVGFYDEAEAHIRRVLLSYENMPETNYVKKAVALEILATVLLKQGKYDDADKFFTHALCNHMERPGREHPTTQKCWARLGQVYDMQGRHDIASQVYDKCLEVLEATLGTSHADVLRVKSYRATNLSNRNKHDEAEKEFRDVLRLMGSNSNNYHENDRRRIALQLVDILNKDPHADDDAWLADKVHRLEIEYSLDLHHRLGWLY